MVYSLETFSQIHSLFTYLCFSICMYVFLCGGCICDVHVYLCMYGNQRSAFTVASQQPSTLVFETCAVTGHSPIGQADWPVSLPNTQCFFFLLGFWGSDSGHCDQQQAHHKLSEFLIPNFVTSISNTQSQNYFRIRVPLPFWQWK